jgi:predicted methyltransferase
MADYSEAPARQAGLDLLAVQPGEKVLEVGFGTGHCLVALAQAVAPTGKVYGIDIALMNRPRRSGTSRHVHQPVRQGYRSRSLLRGTGGQVHCTHRDSPAMQWIGL